VLISPRESFPFCHPSAATFLSVIPFNFIIFSIRQFPLLRISHLIRSGKSHTVMLYIRAYLLFVIKLLRKNYLQHSFYTHAVHLPFQLWDHSSSSPLLSLNPPFHPLISFQTSLEIKLMGNQLVKSQIKDLMKSVLTWNNRREKTSCFICFVALSRNNGGNCCQKTAIWTRKQ
jgi:hypothetical protein